ncbi:hypothetical protein LshimejAT787_0211820 [Lyophyllum shimeji]|uniref:HNH nuclease domain-containing protein n=1 Tax=Lyophyllum shimeji TaxID=47721 RepID=A0A9P3PGG9_LYOSH|nr:hypothetical protein LshimejAT787_0211820 [Lyophyllum shimeji]
MPRNTQSARDRDYMPENDRRSVLTVNSWKTTPSHRHDGDRNTPIDAKRRVDKITCGKSALSGTRCVIENTDESNAVEYAHLLPRSASDDMLDRLEYAWNLKHGSLNVNTRFNILRLSVKFHKLFDMKQWWMLLPTNYYIDKYYSVKDEGRTEFPPPERSGIVYKYTLIAHPEMRMIPIHRQANPPAIANPINNQPPPQPPLPAKDDFTFFVHPYDDFPVIASHVLPRFALYDAGRKICGNLAVGYRKQHPALRQQLDKVEKIYEAWTKELDDGAPDVDAFLNGGGDDSSQGDHGKDDEFGGNDANSDRTGKGRAYPARKRPDTDDGSPGGSKRQRQGYSSKQQRLVEDGTAWLDDVTLREFDQQASLGEKSDCKEHFVLEWLTGVGKEGDVGNTKEYPKGDDKELKDALDAKTVVGNGGVIDAGIYVAGLGA